MEVCIAFDCSFCPLALSYTSGSRPPSPVQKHYSALVSRISRYDRLVEGIVNGGAPQVSIDIPIGLAQPLSAKPNDVNRWDFVCVFPLVTRRNLQRERPLKE